MKYILGKRTHGEEKVQIKLPVFFVIPTKDFTSRRGAIIHWEMKDQKMGVLREGSQKENEVAGLQAEKYNKHVGWRDARRYTRKGEKFRYWGDEKGRCLLINSLPGDN